MWNDDTAGSTVHQPMAHEEGNLTLSNPESDSPKQQAVEITLQGTNISHLGKKEKHPWKYL